MWSDSRRFLFTLLGVFALVSSWAQPQNNSPYSRFGLGDVLNQNFTNLRATPGFANAYTDAYHINLHNPASLGFLQTAAFDLGIYGRRSTWETNTLSNRNWTGNLSHLAVGFTLNNPVNDLLDREERDFSWGMAIALQPFTQVGYTVQTTGNVDDIGSVITQFRGEGGTNQVIWGNGIRYKQFAFGLQASYLFGRIENFRGVIFEDLGSSFQNSFVDDFSINGIRWKVGAQYNFVFNKDDVKKIKILTLGVTAGTNNSLNTTSSSFYTRLNPTFTLPALVTDTLLNATNVDGKATLPASFGIGAVFANSTKYKIGVNYDRTAWSNYRNDAKPEELTDSYRAAFSVEFIPDYASYNKFWERVRYRIGGFTGTDPRSIDGTQISEYGVTLGLGLPLQLKRGQVSFVNLSAELGKRGGNVGLSESYGEFTVGFTLNDNNWFFKRKFN